MVRNQPFGGHGVPTLREFSVAIRMNSEVEFISVIDFASECGTRKQLIFKKMAALRIEGQKRRGDSASRGQLITYLTGDECEQISKSIRNPKPISEEASDDDLDSPYDHGYFYLIQLEPKHDPCRYKVGLAIDVDERVRKHKCAAPLLVLVGSWICRRLWEKTAIDCVAQDSTRLHTEVFRAPSLEVVKTRCDEFFSQMPKLVR
jgi:hypothetical protein